MPHHGLYLVSHGRLEAVHRALGASRLALLEMAFLKTFVGIGQEFTALCAWSGTTMMAVAVKAYHDRDGPAFPGYSGIPIVHGNTLCHRNIPNPKDRALMNHRDASLGIRPVLWHGG